MHQHIDNKYIQGLLDNDRSILLDTIRLFCEKKMNKMQEKGKLMSTSVTMHFRRDLSEFVRIQQGKLALNKC